MSQESSLHQALKALYAEEGPAEIEVPVDGYLVDVVRGQELIEIQTGNFSALKDKLAYLLERFPVRVVHPIAQEKWIVKLPAEGDQPLSRRKSPYKGRPELLFSELVRIPHLALHPNLRLEVLLTREEEVRRDDGRGSWRRKGWSITDRRLLEVVDRIVLENAADFRAFLPDTLPAHFTSQDLARTLKVRRYLAQKTLYCLRQMELVEVVGKRKRSQLYQVVACP